MLAPCICGNREFMDRLAMCMDLLADQRAAQALRLRYGVLDGQQRSWARVGKELHPSSSGVRAAQLVRWISSLVVLRAPVLWPHAVVMCRGVRYVSLGNGTGSSPVPDLRVCQPRPAVSSDAIRSQWPGIEC